MDGKILKRIVILAAVALTAFMPLCAHEYLTSVELGLGPMFEGSTWVGPQVSADIFFDKPGAVVPEKITTTERLRLLNAQFIDWTDLSLTTGTITFDDLATGDYLDKYTESEKNYPEIAAFLEDAAPLADEAAALMSVSTPEVLEAKRNECLAEINRLVDKTDDVWAEALTEISRLQGDQSTDPRKGILAFQMDVVRDKADERADLINPEDYRETRYGTYVDISNTLVEEEVYADISARLKATYNDASGKLSALQAELQKVDNEYEARIKEVYDEAYADIADIREDIKDYVDEYEETFKTVYDTDEAKAIMEEFDALIVKYGLDDDTSKIEKDIRKEERWIDRQNYLGEQSRFTKVGLSVGTSFFFDGSGYNAPRGMVNAGAAFKLYDGRMYRLFLDTDAVFIYGIDGMFGIGGNVALKNYFIFGDHFGFDLTTALTGGYGWNFRQRGQFSNNTFDGGFAALKIGVGFVYRFGV